MKKTKKKPTLDTADGIGMDMLLPARIACEAMGVNQFTLRLCERMGWPYLPRRVQQVQVWLSTDASVWQHPRAGVAKAMLEIEKGQR